MELIVPHHLIWLADYDDAAARLEVVGGDDEESNRLPVLQQYGKNVHTSGTGSVVQQQADQRQRIWSTARKPRQECCSCGGHELAHTQEQSRTVHALSARFRAREAGWVSAP